MNEKPRDRAGAPPRAANIGVVDDHPSVALGVRAVTERVPGITSVTLARTVPELLSQCRNLDLVLLDPRLADGSEVSQNVRLLQAISASVLIFTSGDSPSLIREAARSGAIGMLRKSELPSTLANAIVAALRGEVIASADWAAALESDSRLRDAQLTAREEEVLARYAAGQQADTVALALGIPRETVLDHIRRIRAKYAKVERPAPTKVELYQRAIEDGVIPEKP